MESSVKQGVGSFRAFITGALVGAGLALLFAPKAGVQLRGLLRNYVKRATQEFDETVDRGANMMVDTIDRGHEFLEKGKESVQQVRRHAKDFAEAGQNVVKTIKDG